jgi:hypothetical protein
VFYEGLPSNWVRGLRVYRAEGSELPGEELPPPSPRKYWTRRGIAEWLVDKLAEDVPTLVGIDHGFSFPLRYFEVHSLIPDWSTFLEDFHRHWPTDEDIYVDFGRRCGAAASPEKTATAISMMHFASQPGYRAATETAASPPS